MIKEARVKWKKMERQGWFDHFQQLFPKQMVVQQAVYELDDEFIEMLDVDSDVLNQPVSEAEARAAVSKLKTEGMWS